MQKAEPAPLPPLRRHPLPLPAPYLHFISISLEGRRGLEVTLGDAGAGGQHGQPRAGAAGTATTAAAVDTRSD